MNDALHYALEKALKAPSGENCQPWRFVVHGDIVELWNRPERDRSLYNWGQRASYLACGAALENMVLALGEKGYSCDVRYFPSGDESHVATISMSQHVEADPLAKWIDERTTNRKPYERTPLIEDDRKALFDSLVDPAIKLKLVESRGDILAIGDVGAVNEVVMLTNKKLRDFFFGHVNWTARQDRERSVGFYIKTLELPAPARGMFKLLSYSKIATIMTSLGVQNLVRNQNATINTSAGAVGALISQSSDPVSFVKTGRAAERVWLAATACGLSVQPLTGVLFMNLMIGQGGDTAFLDSQRALITDAYERARRIFDAQNILFMFRIGRAHPPSARSSRFAFTISVEET